ncbi:abscisic acid receptor PYL8 [Tripterygium wilfordii]|uniref:Abscisic acid receptor PYL8 n=1 Tax=Tripterygium wilfordii TaxID=458696 RepID=A0A7J7CBD1_TRIWF|nr:abscisic acid receptor PYL8 [Tripterygium wilfordii]
MNGNGNIDGFESVESEYIRRHHSHDLAENQSSCALVKHIKAPVHLVWSLVRRFDQPQTYKPFVSSRFAGANRTSYSKFTNYSSTISLHPEIIDGRPGTLVIESFVVDVPDDNTNDETCYFVEAFDQMQSPITC